MCMFLGEQYHPDLDIWCRWQSKWVVQLSRARKEIAAASADRDHLSVSQSDLKHRRSHHHIYWWKTEVVPQPFRIRYRSALWLRSNFLNPSEFPPCILTCSKKFLPWGWAICWAISWDVRGIWSIAPTKCRSLSERPPDLSVPQCVTLSVWERRNNFLTQSAEVTNAKVTNANAH